MKSFRDACKWAESELDRLEDPALEARLLMCHLMKWRSHQFLLNRDTMIPARVLADYSLLVERRRSREPLQHITGSVEFLGRQFFAGPGALVPRPETETLAGIFMKGLSNPQYLLDLGTGSGVLAVSLALEYPEATVIASDLSAEALKIAIRNIRSAGADNVHPLRMDMLEALNHETACFDGIVANLPYVPSEQLPSLQPEVRDGDPWIALDGGSDGLRLVSILIGSAPVFMRDQGFIALELASGQVDMVAVRMSESASWKDVKTHRDLTGRKRFVTAKRDGGILN